MRGAKGATLLRDIDELIEDAFSGRSPTAREVQVIAEHIAATGFDPVRQINASREIAGLTWRGQRIEAGERIAVNAAHYLKHVVLQREWPAGTTLAQYEADTAFQPVNGLDYVNRKERARL